MKHLSLSILTALGALSFISGAQADDKADNKITHVVELFTSQGCSSCPPANRTVASVADEPGVLALSYGVTYWDYLGWEDTFGDPKFTDRQRDYREVLNGANLYTPQIVLNGSAHSPRYSAKDIRSMALPKANYVSAFDSAATGMMLTSDVPAGGSVAIVTYMPGVQDVPVKRGENHGRTLKIANVVTDIKTVPWNGDPQVIATPEAGHAIAALFHAEETAKIIAVATYTP